MFISEVYADPSYASYKALRFVSGVLTTFTPAVYNQLIFSGFSLFFSLLNLYASNFNIHIYVSLGRSENHPIIHGRLQTGLGTFF